MDNDSHFYDLDTIVLSRVAESKDVAEEPIGILFSGATINV